MINKKQITEMAQKILKHSEGLRDPRIMHPERDWAIGLLIALCIVVASVSDSVYMYWKDKSIDFVTQEPSQEPAVVYRESVVKDALARFDKRNEEREALLSEFSKQPIVVKEEVVQDAATTTAPSEEVAPDTVSPQLENTGL